MSRDLPVPKEVKDLLEELLGRSVMVGLTDPMHAADVTRTLVAVYKDNNNELSAVVGLDFELTAYVGAAIGLIPAGGAEACIEDNEISKMIGENAIEVCNILGGFLSRKGGTHLKLHGTFLPGDRPPTDAVGYLLAVGRRIDLTVDIGGYGSGRLSFAYAGSL